jgi:hypothetical protein
VAETMRLSPSVREFISQLRVFFVANEIATEPCFDRWIFEATKPISAQRRRKVTSIGHALKRARAQRRMTGKRGVRP